MHGRTELPWLLLGRHVAPLGLAASFACAVEAWYSLIVGNTAGNAFDRQSTAGLILGGAALLATVLLNLGWWRRRRTLTRTGLWVAATVFATRTLVLLIDTPTPGTTNQSVWFSAAWVLAIGGAFLLEVHDPEDSRDEVRRATWRGDH